MRLTLPFFILSLLHQATAIGASLFPSQIYSGTNAIAAITIGDFDPEHPGSEIACLLGNGSVIKLALDDAGWNATNIFEYTGTILTPWEDPRNRVTLRLGDVIAAAPGQELVVSYGRQIAAIYFTPEIGWTNQVISDLSDNFGVPWASTAGDCDPSHPGDEVVSIFEGIFDFSSGSVHREVNGAWESDLIYNAEVVMDLAIGDSNPEHPGNEIVLTTEMGPTYEITPPADGGPGPWPIRMLWDDYTNAGWVLKIANVEPETPENEVIYGTRYSDRILISRYRGTNEHDLEIVFTGSNTNEEFNSMLDIAVGRISPESEGPQILGVDVSGHLYLLQRATNEWRGAVAWQDASALYAVAAADLASSPGDEIAVGGASGVVTLLSQPAPRVQPSLSEEQQTLLSWRGIPGVGYTVETKTDIASADSWSAVTNFTYNGVFDGRITWTNTTDEGVPTRFYRVKAEW